MLTAEESVGSLFHGNHPILGKIGFFLTYNVKGSFGIGQKVDNVELEGLGPVRRCTKLRCRELKTKVGVERVSYLIFNRRQFSKRIN